MALHVGAQMNGVGAVSHAEEQELYAQLLRLEDAVLSGKHPHFKLPPAAVEQLKASLIAWSASPESGQPSMNGSLNGIAFAANAATNHVQPSTSPAMSNFPGLPGLSGLQHSRPSTLKPTSSGGLDPIFLEKSDSLVRAEGQLKRQRIERELQSQQPQMEQRRYTRDRDQAADAPHLDVEMVLLQSGAREIHVSGLRPSKAASPSSSFDENDYYSSQVESAQTADVEVFNGSFASSAKNSAAGKRPLRDQPHQPSNITAEVEMYDIEDDDDDEYAPPEATVFDSFVEQSAGVSTAQMALAEDEDSDYEPGEITQETNVPAPYHQVLQPAQPSPRVPVIRNHLTHIAAPQPNRVSPLAVAKGPSLELELVNGRPEIVQKARQNHHAIQSRGSTASPSANGAPGSNKKRRQKKRKREAEPNPANPGRNKRKLAKQNGAHSPGPAHQEPRIKDEPVSPPPFVGIQDVPQYAQRTTQYGVPEIDLISPRYAPLPAGYAQEPPRSALRYEYSQPTSPAIIRAASPAPYRSVQRDTQDLRRVASLHHAQRPPSPGQQHTPTAHRTVSMTYGDPRLSRASVAPAEAEPVRYAEQMEEVRYVRQRSRSPPRLQEYHDPYARVQSPAMMPPPSAPPRRIVVDQYGNRYYAADPAPAPMPSRASVAPVDRQMPMGVGYERAPSRMATSAMSYEPRDVRMGPPPIPSRRQEETQIQYMEPPASRTREYSTRPIEQQMQYVEAPTSPVYQARPRYEQMPPPPAPPIREPTSPVYAPPRSYSVRPEDPTPQAYSMRQASVAPVQYVREAPPPPMRAMSVMPGYEQTPTRAYSQAPQAVQAVRYVDQYGREVYPEVRQVPAAEYRYQ